MIAAIEGVESKGLSATVYENDMVSYAMSTPTQKPLALTVKLRTVN